MNKTKTPNLFADMEIGSDKWKEVINIGADTFDIQIDSEKMDRFAAHAAELMQWNKKINLTAICKPLEIAVKHVLDSIIPSLIIPSDKKKLLDIGSGGGFPGIPLKILLPSLSVTLIDASRKKVNFLKHIIRTLKLENIDALHIRAEEMAGTTGFEKKFDVIISRALTSLESFIAMALPLLSENGMIIALKGNVEGADIKAVKSLIKSHAMLLTLRQYPLPFLKDKRTIVSVRYRI
ncbi:MAG: 16S rRNA (guanine(527)-N(7))-methyltransferase RsmG [Deltaproteobacteria bacterium]|nr:16S rRNA (guanine(527)-N(7))-methyltransferase RsmG [Deltaproteobacteria bacterium]